MGGGKILRWNIAPECVSVILLCIIWVYSRKGTLIPSLKNRLFQFCFLTTLIAMVTNILSTVMIYNSAIIPLFLTHIVTLIYFIFTPLMGVSYFCYSSTFSFEKRNYPGWFGLTLIPAIIYVFFVLANPLTGWLFTLTSTAGYQQGPLISLTYIVFYIYCLACFVLGMMYKHSVDPQIRKILTSFPLLALAVIFFQQIFPETILSGSAATFALLIIYLYLQNKQISMDYLLRIPNHQEFVEMLQMLVNGKMSKEAVVLVISLRGFKRINDRAGQQNGDAFLKVVCSYLQSIAKHHTLYRYSGDEFAILFMDDSKKEVDDFINKLNQRMELNWEVNQLSVQMSVVIGMVHFPEIASTMEDIVNGLEHCVLRAKQSKTSNVCRFNIVMLEELKRRNQVIAVLQDCILNNSLQVYVQPIWSIKEQAFTLAESLLRIPDSSIGPIFPDEMIPIAEDTGLIIPMTYQILEKVCVFIRKMEENKIEIDSVSVNFSAIQFTQEDLAEKIIDIIRKYEIVPSKIKIEITESVLAQTEEFNQFIDDMHRFGVQIALDDFGTGYCNLVSVMSMPLDVVKLDKSLLWSSLKNPKSAIMMRTITHAVHELGMKIVSEGAETENHADFIIDCGCDWIQGYYFAKPMAMEEAMRVIQASALVQKDKVIN